LYTAPTYHTGGRAVAGDGGDTRADTVVPIAVSGNFVVL